MWKLKIAEGKDPWLESLNNFTGRQHWEFDPEAGTTEERAEVERAREEFKRNRFNMRQSADLLMRMELRKGKPLVEMAKGVKLKEREVIGEEAVTTTLKKAINFFTSIQAHDGHWPSDNAGPLYFMPPLISISNQKNSMKKNGGENNVQIVGGNNVKNNNNNNNNNNGNHIKGKKKGGNSSMAAQNQVGDSNVNNGGVQQKGGEMSEMKPVVVTTLQNPPMVGGGGSGNLGIYPNGMLMTSEYSLKETRPHLGGGLQSKDKTSSTYDLVEQMQYLYVKVVKARELSLFGGGEVIGDGWVSGGR